MGYTIYQKPDGSYWFRCKECGHGAGYSSEERCKQMAELHVDLPHTR